MGDLIFETFVKINAIFHDEKKECPCCKEPLKEDADDIIMIGCGRVCCRGCAIDWYDKPGNRACMSCRKPLWDKESLSQARL